MLPGGHCAGACVVLGALAGCASPEPSVRSVIGDVYRIANLTREACSGFVFFVIVHLEGASGVVLTDAVGDGGARVNEAALVSAALAQTFRLCVVVWFLARCVCVRVGVCV